MASIITPNPAQSLDTISEPQNHYATLSSSPHPERVSNHLTHIPPPHQSHTASMDIPWNNHPLNTPYPQPMMLTTLRILFFLAHSHRHRTTA